MCAARLARCVFRLRLQPDSSSLRSCLRHSASCNPVKVSSVNVHPRRWYSQSVADTHDLFSDEDLLNDDASMPSESSGASFSSFPLGRDVLQRLDELGFKEPFEIQEKTLPLTLDGKDVIGRAVTGSGKTLAYALPIIHTLSKTQRGKDPRALVITPTRELCNQVYQSIQSLDHNIRCVALYGGAPYYEQESAIRRGVDMVCATPGRLNDHLFKKRTFGLQNVKFLILDEADELLTPQFREQIEDVMSDVPGDKQMMLFSATMPQNIKNLTKRYMKDPIVVDLTSNRSLVPEKIVHEYLRTTSVNTLDVVPDLLLNEQPKRALVFTPTKVQTHVLASQLTNFGFKASALNSDMSQQSRDACIKSFKSGEIDVLVATDVAARGLDVPELDLVIQVDIPPSGVDFYIHRSGRTGRKGQAGKTILVCSKRNRLVGSFLYELEGLGITLTKIKVPSPKSVANRILGKVAIELNPEKMHSRAIEVALPYAKELIQTYGEEKALAAAIVAYSNLDSKFKADEEKMEDADDDGWGMQRSSGGWRNRGGRGQGGFGQDRGRFGQDRGRFGQDRGRFGQDRGRFGQDRGRFGQDRGGYGLNRRGFGQDLEEFGQDHGVVGGRGGYGYTYQEQSEHIHDEKKARKKPWKFSGEDLSHEDDLDNMFSWDQHK